MAEVIIRIKGDTADANAAVEALNKQLGDTGKATIVANKESDQLTKSLEKQEIRLKKLDGVINIVGGSIEVLAGGLATTGLVSKENAEQFEAAALGAIALADGSKRILDGVKTYTEAQKLANTATEGAAVAQNSLNLAVLKNPYVIAAVALAALVGGLYAYSQATSEAAIQQNILNNVETKANEKTAEQVVNLRLLQQVLNDSTKSEEQRESALTKLQKLLPELEGLDLGRADAIQKVNLAITKEIGLIQQRARVEAATERLVELEKERLALIQEVNDPGIFRKTIAALSGLQTGLGYTTMLAVGFGEEFRTINDETEFLTEYINQNLSPTLEGLGDDIEENIVDKSKAAADALQKLNAAIAVQTEAELSLLSEKNREIKERETRFNTDLATLKEAGFTDFTALEEEYRIDLAAINKKYDDATIAEQDRVNKEIEAKLISRRDLINEIDTASAITEEEKRQLRIQQITIYYNTLIEKARAAGLSEIELEEAKQRAITAATQEGIDDRSGLEKFFASDLGKAIGGSLSTVASFSKTLSDVQDETTKEAFEQSKKYKVAEVVTSAISSAFQAFGAAAQFGPILGPILGAVQVAAIALASKKAIADINASQFGGSTPSLSSPSAGGGASAVLATSPSFGTGGFLGQPQGTLTPITSPQGPLRAYVVSADVTNGQQAQAQIERRRTLGPG